MPWKIFLVLKDTFALMKENLFKKIRGIGCLETFNQVLFAKKDRKLIADLLTLKRSRKKALHYI